MSSEQLISFFANNGVDDRGRTLVQIIEKSDDWLERTHDFIQWIFPLAEKSGANPNAPLIDANLVSLFRNNESVRMNMLIGFDRMLTFYGLNREGTSITKGGNWDQRKGNWFVSPTHNDLRITRMLKSMSLLGLGEYAQGFLDSLLMLTKESGCGFSENAIGFWKSAALSKWNA